MRSTVWLGVVLFFCVSVMVLGAGEAMASTESITQLTSLDPEFKPIKFLLPKGVRLTSITSDGSIIAFSWWEYLPETNPDCSGEIFVVNSDGTGLLQLTSDDSIDGPYHSLFPSISADGAVVAFASEANLTGENPDSWYQIFAVNSDDNGLRQLTDGVEPFDSLFPSISGDGSLVVFQSKADFTAENPNHTSQVFLADSSGVISQITKDPDHGSWHPSISADGSAVAFACTAGADPMGGNSDHSAEVFVIDSGGYPRQLTSAEFYASAYPSISADGSAVAFVSQADLTDANPDHLSQVFAVNSDGTGLTQLTIGSDPYVCWRPSISADGAAVAFESNADLTGGNPDHSFEMFVVNSDGTGLRQLTNWHESNRHSQYPAISGDGMAVAFLSTADLTDGNPDYSTEAFLASGLFAYTPEGSDVTVEPGEGIDMTFGDVTGGGETTVEVSEDPPGQSPADFRFLGVYYDINTTADYEPPITIKIPFDPDALPEGRLNSLKVEQFDPDTGVWEDVTVYVPDPDHPDKLVPLIDWSTDPPKIVAEVTHLSWFGVGYAIYDFKGFLPPLEDSHAKPFKRGSTIPIKFRISDEAGNPVPEAGATLVIDYGESDAEPGDPEVVSTAPGDSGNEFRYDPADDLYIFNLSTKHDSFEANQSYDVVVTLDDGEMHTTTFGLR